LAEAKRRGMIVVTYYVANIAWVSCEQGSRVAVAGGGGGEETTTSPHHGLGDNGVSEETEGEDVLGDLRVKYSPRQRQGSRGTN